MSYVANPFVVVLDACVLYPFRIRDILLTFAAEGLCRARLTEDIVDEWTRNLIQNKPDLEKSVLSQKLAIETHFEEAFVTGYRPLIEGLELPDPDDRHVLAAAIKCSAQAIVTENHKDFPSEYLDEFDIETLSADDFLVQTFELFQPRACLALRSVRERYGNPPFSRSEFLVDLTANGLPKLAAVARAHIEFL